MEANTSQIIDQLKAIDGGKPYVAPTPEAQPAPEAAPAPAVTIETPVVEAAPVAAPAVTETPAAAPVQTTSGAELELAQLRTKLSEYEAKSQLSPFASDLVKEINRLASTGASPTEISRFIEIQSLEVSSMDDDTAIKTAWKLENPALNDKEIDAMFRKKFSADEDDEDAMMLASAERKTAALGAKAKLTEKKVSSVPESARQAELQQARIEQAQAAWGPITGALGNEIDFTTDVDGAQVSYKYSIPEPLLAGYRQKAAAWAAQMDIPLNEQGAAQVRKFIEICAWGEKGDEIKDAIVKNAYQAAVKAVKAQEAGAPAATPSMEPAAATGLEDTINQLKAMDRQTFRT